MNEIKRTEIAENIFFTNIKDNRFKTIKISVTMIVPLESCTASAYSLLTQVMTRSCSDYPMYMELNKKLAYLYGATLCSYSSKLGDNLALTFSITGLDDRYAIDKERISSELVDLLCSIIFRPLLENDAFCTRDVEQERRQLLDLIDSEFNEKRVFAVNRMIEIMCSDQPFGLRRYGTKEQALVVTEKELFNVWKKMLNSAKIEIFMIGNSDSLLTSESFTEAFKNQIRTPLELCDTPVSSGAEIKEVTDKMDVAQSKLVMGFKTGTDKNSPDVYAERLMCAVLGGTAHSKLFLNVREKYSLCYYCASSFYRSKGFILVESGVEKDNIEKAKKEILNQIEEMKKGNITDEEISFTKLSMANSFNTMYDTMSSMESFYISQTMNNEILSPSQTAEKINAVTKSQVIEAAQKLQLNTVYVLTSNE